LFSGGAEGRRVAPEVRHQVFEMLSLVLTECGQQTGFEQIFAAGLPFGQDSPEGHVQHLARIIFLEEGRQITVTVKGDTTEEYDETILVNLAARESSRAQMAEQPVLTVGDPLYELAVITCGDDLYAEEADELVACYLGREASAGERSAVLDYCCVYRYLELLWYLAQRHPALDAGQQEKAIGLLLDALERTA